MLTYLRYSRSCYSVLIHRDLVLDWCDCMTATDMYVSDCWDQDHEQTTGKHMKKYKQNTREHKNDNQDVDFS